MTRRSGRLALEVIGVHGGVPRRGRIDTVRYGSAEQGLEARASEHLAIPAALQGFAHVDVTVDAAENLEQAGSIDARHPLTIVVAVKALEVLVQLHPFSIGSGPGKTHN